VDQDMPLIDFHHDFLKYTAASANGSSLLDSSGFYSDSTLYYTHMRTWLQGDGRKYQSDVIWMDPKCANATDSSCQVASGIKASKLQATCALEHTGGGQERYDTMTSLRSSVKGIISGAFPYRETWLYWEEVGVIGTEFSRNLAISGGAICVMVAALIPNLRVAPCVIISILLSVTNVVGFMHWWNITISGISTIYVIISIGLAVDYSAHIGHMFASSSGDSRTRAVKALHRIGPSVFNAIISTLLAVIVLAFSESYVFRIFFKVLCLTVLIGGSHGIIFLPVLLAVVGGSRTGGADDDETVIAMPEDTQQGITLSSEKVYPMIHAPSEVEVTVPPAHMQPQPSAQ